MALHRATAPPSSMSRAERSLRTLRMHYRAAV
jgi:hypothetical protein